MTFKCQICNIRQSTSNLTKCCKLFICQQCKQFYQNDKSLSCICGKNISNKKLCSQNSLIYKIVQQVLIKRHLQCDRCTQPAIKLCHQCNMNFCQKCDQQLHQKGTAYAKHTRKNNQNNQIKSINQVKNLQMLCNNDQKQAQFICECSALLCNYCLRLHGQSCQKGKPRSLKQGKQEYFVQIMSKINQINDFKQKLQKQKIDYEQNFTNEKIKYKQTKRSIYNQFEALKKILQLKTKQVEQSLIEYWYTCQESFRKVNHFIDFNLNKFDDYARLSQKFVQYQVGLDYLERRVKQINIDKNIFNFKVVNHEQIKQQIMNIESIYKIWQSQLPQNFVVNGLEQSSLNMPTIIKKVGVSLQSLGLNQINPQLLSVINLQPFTPRPLSFKYSHNSIQFSFLHLSYQNLQYEVQYGVGFKMKGIQVFKNVINHNGKGIIQKLNSNIKYRIRMRVKEGQFGQVEQVTTLDAPKFYIQPTNTYKATGQNTFQFLKQGIIYGTNPICFGIHQWLIILNSQKCSYQQSQTACISIGISNKQSKKPSFTGSTFNYGYQRGQIIIKIMINCEDQTMIITNSNNNLQEEKYNLGGLPVFPAIQNKSSTSVHVKYSFTKDEF